jgi:hypothetical protein
MMEAGLSPALPTDIVMGLRTFPIRVAGNSGPMLNEISWPTLAREINAKRERKGLDPLVAGWAIDQFESAVRMVAHSNTFITPVGSDGTDQEQWGDRVRYRVALSEVNKSALAALSDDTRRELSNLFEMTTVTKKLRRVARLTKPELERAARQIRPHQVVVTFLNYEFPTRWFDSSPLTLNETAYLGHISETCGGAPVTIVNRGPAPEHMIETGAVPR